MKKQAGVSLGGLLVVSALVIVVALVGFKMLPAYLEYFTVQRIVRDLAHAPDMRGGSVQDVQRGFDRRAQIDNVNAVKGSDLEIAKQGDRFDITVNYSVRVPLFANVSACVDFEATGK
jgi:Domain of unknown function (DUF4845)